MASFVEKLNLILTIQCQRASELISESFERKLLLHERLALRGHIVVCWSCRQFEKHLRLIRLAFRKLDQQEKQELAATMGDPANQMDESFKQRLKQLRP